jgi:HEPN domain-containing protein
MNANPHEVEAQRWIELAEDDLAAAETLLSSGAVKPRQTCYSSQQAAEKALKAVLIMATTKYPWKHDLVALEALVPNGWGVKVYAAELPYLTQWAIAGRYPDPTAAPLTITDAQTALETARKVVKSARADIDARSIGGP